jgi:hypothetical protein
MLQRDFQGRTKAPLNKPDIFKQSRKESRRLAGGTSLTRRKDFDSLFFRQVPHPCGLFFARVDLSFLPVSFPISPHLGEG